MEPVLCPVLVGRDRELARLDAALEAARRGHGGVVVLSGEAGIGKSRLTRELMAAANAAGAVVGCGRGMRGGAAVPFRPLTEALQSLLRGRHLPTDDSFRPWRAALAPILPTLVDEGAADLTTPVRAEAVRQLLGAVATGRRALLVLEDLHWADPDTIAIVEYLIDNLDGASVLCLATVRDPDGDEHAQARRLVRHRGAIHVALERLDADRVVTMVQACVPEVDDETVRRIQRDAEGVPFLVEEILASPGVPASFRESVRTRLAELGDEERSVLSVAALLGREFEWELLPDATALDIAIVDRALERAVQRQLLTVEGDQFAFRHALTREAIIERLLPPRRRALAASALAALERAHPELNGAARDVAADLAVRAGDSQRAALLLADSGRAARAQGALATAIERLGDAYRLGNRSCGPLLIESLALAGRVDEAVARFGDVAREAADPETTVGIHLAVAQAAVAATRWELATAHLADADALIDDTMVAARARELALEADVAMAHDEFDRARALATSVADLADAPDAVRCHAFEILGRIERPSDQRAAREYFEAALDLARRAQLPVWMLRANHELGTIDMFERMGTERLLEARRVAGECGAMSTAAVVDLQLAAVSLSRFELDAAERHAASALTLSERLGLHQVQAKALFILAEHDSWSGNASAMEQRISRALELEPDDRALQAFASGARGMFELFHGTRARAVDELARAADGLRDLPHAEPAAFRAVWPVLAASHGDHAAGDALRDARRLGVGSFDMNAGLLAHGDAILAGARGDRDAARRIARNAERSFGPARAWLAVARALVAESAARGWDEPAWWLTGVETELRAHGLSALAARAAELSDDASRWSRLGITTREADVLHLVAQGQSNRDIAAALGLSPRTVEKHVESLLRKVGARSRTHLVVSAEARLAELDT